MLICNPDTRMQVFLPEALKAKGGSVKIKIDFLYISERRFRQNRF
jgi:hypothetical protein